VTLTFKVNDGAADSNTGTVTINVGYRNVYVDTTPLVVTAPLGAKPTRSVRLYRLPKGNWKPPINGIWANVSASSSTGSTRTTGMACSAPPSTPRVSDRQANKPS
jgi:hypothetical protein